MNFKPTEYELVSVASGTRRSDEGGWTLGRDAWREGVYHHSSWLASVFWRSSLERMDASVDGMDGLLAVGAPWR